MANSWFQVNAPVGYAPYTPSVTTTRTGTNWPGGYLDGQFVPGSEYPTPEAYAQRQTTQGQTSGGPAGYNWVYGQNPGWMGPDGQMYDQGPNGEMVPRAGSGGVAGGPLVGNAATNAAQAITRGRPQTAGPGTPANAPPGGYTEDWFTQNFGRPTTNAQLVAMEDKLGQAGIKILRSASGNADKVQLPDGTIVDVIVGGTPQGGGTGFAWQVEGPGGSNFAPYAGTFTGGGQYPLASVMGSGLMQPWTTPFQAPTDVTQQNDPGWQFRMKEGLQALERSGAAKGTLLTGGMMKDLNAWAQEFASNEYDRVYNRALGEYRDAYNIFNANQANQFGRLNTLSGQGLNAAGASSQAASGYGQNASNTIENIGNVNAAGTMGSANAWRDVPGSIADTINTGIGIWATRPRGSDGTVIGREPDYTDWGSANPADPYGYDNPYGAAYRNFRF